MGGADERVVGAVDAQERRKGGAGSGFSRRSAELPGFCLSFPLTVNGKQLQKALTQDNGHKFAEEALILATLGKYQRHLKNRLRQKFVSGARVVPAIGNHSLFLQAYRNKWWLCPPAASNWKHDEEAVTLRVFPGALGRRPTHAHHPEAEFVERRRPCARLLWLLLRLRAARRAHAAPQQQLRPPLLLLLAGGLQARPAPAVRARLRPRRERARPAAGPLRAALADELPDGQRAGLRAAAPQPGRDDPGGEKPLRAHALPPRHAEGKFLAQAQQNAAKLARRYRSSNTGDGDDQRALQAYLTGTYLRDTQIYLPPKERQLLFALMRSPPSSPLAKFLEDSMDIEADNSISSLSSEMSSEEEEFLLQLRQELRAKGGPESDYEEKDRSREKERHF